MTLDLLDLLLVSHFCFNAQVPVWMWVMGIFACIVSNLRLYKMDKDDK